MSLFLLLTAPVDIPFWIVDSNIIVRDISSCKQHTADFCPSPAVEIIQCVLGHDARLLAFESDEDLFKRKNTRSKKLKFCFSLSGTLQELKFDHRFLQYIYIYRQAKKKMLSHLKLARTLQTRIRVILFFCLFTICIYLLLFWFGKVFSRMYTMLVMISKLVNLMKLNEY